MLRLHVDPTVSPGIQVGGCAVWETIASLAVLARFRVRGAGLYMRWATGVQHQVPQETLAKLWSHVSQVSPPAPTDTSAPDFAGSFADPGLASALDTYWSLALAPHWDNMREALQAEAKRRQQTLVARGSSAMLGNIGGRLRWRAPYLASPHQEEIHYVAKGALRLVPMVFGGGHALFTALPAGTASLSYAVPVTNALRAPADKRASDDGEQHDPLSILVGPRRAELLRCLRQPATTTTLSAELGIAPSTASEHLRDLLRAGAVRRRRRGAEVFYELDRGGFTLLGEFS